MLINIWWVSVRLYKNPFKAFRFTRSFVTRFSKMMGGKKLVRGFKLDGKYYWDMFNPAWPSKGFNSFYRTHILEEHPLTGDEKLLRRLLIAITKQCPLNCEHCSEGETLHDQDRMSYDIMTQKIDKFVDEGVGQLVYSGGEPLSRFDDLIKLISRYNKKCDQWIYTSAFGLTINKAEQLKAAGLNGAAISLDHHSEFEHNSFRRNDKSYYWVLEGIKNLQQVGIMVSINVCPSKEYIEAGYFQMFIELSKELGVPIVNILEPRAVGNFANKNVELEDAHKEILTEISHKYNFNRKYIEYPTVLYPGAYRNSIPCGGGRSYLLLDYDGQLYPCPFCKVKMPVVKSEEPLCLAG